MTGMEALAALTRVQHLHRPITHTDHYGTWLETRESCNTCLLPYPCPTIRAIEGNQA